MHLHDNFSALKQNEGSNQFQLPLERSPKTHMAFRKPEKSKHNLTSFLRYREHSETFRPSYITDDNPYSTK